jgi:hypothetical protein
MKNKQSTIKDIEKLTAFLPILYAEGFAPVKRWNDEEEKNGVFTLPYPSYDKMVDEFFRQVSNPVWLADEYNPAQASAMLKDDNLIRTASISQIKTMLTFCLRGERFCDGHWAAVITGGYIRKILERLNEIKEKMLKKQKKE